MQNLIDMLIRQDQRSVTSKRPALWLTTPAMLALLLVGCGDDDSLDENESGQADISVELSSRDSSTVKINSSWFAEEPIPDTAYVTYTENGVTKLSESPFCLLAYHEYDNTYFSSSFEGYADLVYAKTVESSTPNTPRTLSIIKLTYDTKNSIIGEGTERIWEGVNQSSLQVENNGKVIFSDENDDIQKIWGSYSLGLNPDCDVDGDGIINKEDLFPIDACADKDADNDSRPDSIKPGCTTDLVEDIDDDFDNSFSLVEMRYPVTINVKLVPTSGAEDLSGEVTITHGKKAGQLIKQYSYSDIQGELESTWLVWPEETFKIENHDDQYRGDLSVIIEVEGEQVCQERVPYVLLTNSFMRDEDRNDNPTCTITADEEIDVNISLGKDSEDKSISFNTQWTDVEEIACGSDPADANNDPNDSDFDHVCYEFDAFPNDSCASDDVDEDGMPDSLLANCITNLTLDDEVTIG